MRLSTFTEYSLRVLIYLARAPEGRATIGEIARAFDISEHHLVKVVHFLGREGLLANRRGCRLQRILGEALGKFYATLEQCTLAKLHVQPAKLQATGARSRANNQEVLVRVSSRFTWSADTRARGGGPISGSMVKSHPSAWLPRRFFLGFRKQSIALKPI